MDYFSLVPANRRRDLQQIAGEGSPLARKHKVHLHDAAVATLPDGYEVRIKEILPGRFKHVRLFVVDPYDLVLSKLSRNEERDRQDVKHLAKTLRLDGDMLRARYDAELRTNSIGPPERHDATLKFWLEAYFGES